MNRSTLGLALLGAALAAGPGCWRKQPGPVEIEAESMRDPAIRILNAGLNGNQGWRRLTALTDQIGPRPSGSPELDRAIAWARESFVADGQANVHLEGAQVPHWVRGQESAAVVEPHLRPLAMLALGGSVGTPPAGLTAEVVAVSTFAELDKLGPAVAGKIVLYDHAMSPAGPPGLAYRDAIGYRVTGADRASRLGAVAVLVRSLTARSLGVPHTGWMKYAGDVPKIPAATLSVEDAELVARLVAEGPRPVKVRLVLGAERLPDAPSSNVVAEIRGRERPDEVVLLGAHLDSWDVGQGAQDDGSGVAMVMEALAAIRRSGVEPRRTVRAVLFTGEEEGRFGAKQYAALHRAELGRLVAAFECDAGMGAPSGFVTDGAPPWTDEVRIFARLLEPLGTTVVEPGFPGEDVDELKAAGTPRFGLRVDIEHYFDVHHSAADTLDKIDPQNLVRGSTALATMAFLVAERPERWRDPAPAPVAAAKP